ncbi:hypothetical protein O9929_07645 [Vibrio lentus]|nr:hypothetical protein [Vibrio lentus]
MDRFQACLYRINVKDKVDKGVQQMEAIIAAMKERQRHDLIKGSRKRAYCGFKCCWYKTNRMLKRVQLKCKKMMKKMQVE